MKKRIAYKVFIDDLIAVLEGNAVFTNFPKGAKIYDIDFDHSDEWTTLFCTSKDFEEVANGDYAPTIRAFVEKK